MTRFIFITQVYPPDPASVGQHFEDAAVRFANRGHTVLIFCADRDYNNPKIKYSATSRHPNVKVVRLPFSSFGKKSILHRLVGQFLFLAQVFIRLLFIRDIDGVLLTTIPATTGIMYLFLRTIRRLPTVYWVMDLNPDQAIVQGIVTDRNLSARILQFCNLNLVRSAQLVIVMDVYMRNRLLQKAGDAGSLESRIRIVAPWPMESHLSVVQRDQNLFIKKHELVDKRILMYSGNHSLVHPLDTILEVLPAFEKSPDLAFLFVGGGRGKSEIDTFISQSRQANVVSLPYQPLAQISHSLSAAHVHFVVMGDPMVGIVHPCKIYGAMAVAKPVVFIGPKDSPSGQLIIKHGFGWVVEHGDAKTLQSLIQEIIAMTDRQLEEMGRSGYSILQNTYSADLLAESFCDLIEEYTQTQRDG